MNTRPSVSDILGTKLVLDTQESGRVAALSGEHVSTCPWRNPGTDRDRALQLMWVRGYAMGRTELRERRQSPTDTRVIGPADSAG